MSNKPTKANVARAAARIGAKFEVDRDSVFICAPTGHHFVYGRHGYHFAEWPTDYCAKSLAYECCLEMLADGVEPCEAGCDCGEK